MSDQAKPLRDLASDRVEALIRKFSDAHKVMLVTLSRSELLLR